MNQTIPPARLLSEDVAKLLGFKKHDIPILVKARLLDPLGNPARNTVKYFAASIVETLGKDAKWLGNATKAVNRFWAKQNAKRKEKPNCALESPER